MPFLTLSKEAQKEFVKLPKSEKKKVDRKLKYLKVNPFTGKPLTGELKSFFSLKAWPYRIIYEFIEAKNQVKIHKIQH
jgi:mRNA-degrading endonuclease RelE of RelBE toxin-antitoxin system